MSGEGEGRFRARLRLRLTEQRPQLAGIDRATLVLVEVVEGLAHL